MIVWPLENQPPSAPASGGRGSSAAPEPNGCAGAGGELAAGIAIDHGDFDPAGAADQRDQASLRGALRTCGGFPRCARRRSRSPSHRAGSSPRWSALILVIRLPKASRKITSPTKPWSSAVGLEVPEGDESVSSGAELGGVTSAKEMGGRGREDVAAMESGRDDRALDRGIGKLPDARGLAPACHSGEQSVVGQHEPLVREHGRDQSPLGADTGVNDD